MCTGTDSAATVKGNTTSAQDTDARARARAKLDEQKNFISEEEYQSRLKALEGSATANTANNFQTREQTNQGFDIAPPADSPDMADELLRKRRAAAATSLMLGRGRKSTMPGANYGDLQIGKTKLFGGGDS